MAQANGITFRGETVSITSGQTVSTALSLEGLSIVGISMPSAFTGTTMTFQTSIDGVTYQALNNTAGNAVSCTVAASKNIGIMPSDFAGWPYIKVVSGSTEGGTRTITLLTRVLS